MKLADIIKILAEEFGTSDLKEINKIFKSKSELKFRLMGRALGHFGFTGQIKSLSEAGFKVYKANKVVLIPLEDIETFGKPNSRDVRVARKAAGLTKPVAAKPEKTKVVFQDDDEDFDDDEDDDDDDFEDFEDFEEEVVEKKTKPKKSVPTGKSGSKFIPVKK